MKEINVDSIELTQELNNKLTTISFGGMELYFSYSTLVGIRDGYDTPLVRENVWGPTTGRHLNRIDGGSDKAKARRLSYDDFNYIAKNLKVGLDV